jgi:hypothetical protein
MMLMNILTGTRRKKRKEKQEEQEEQEKRSSNFFLANEFWKTNKLYRPLTFKVLRNKKITRF